MSVLFDKKDAQSSAWIRCAFSREQDLVLNFQRKPTENSVINSYETHLIDSSAKLTEKSVTEGELIHVNGDDATPWKINGTYIGANHGCASVLETSLAENALTAADIGSSWKDESGATFYVIDVPTTGKAWMLSENLATYPMWKFHNRITGTTLTRVSDGATLAIEKTTLTQLWPCARIKEQKFLADGKSPLVSGKLIDCASLDIVEEYDIINPAAVLAEAIKHPGRKVDFVAPHLDAVINNKIVYRITPNAAVMTSHQAKALQSFDLEFMGFIQQALLQALTGSSDVIRYYIPNTSPFQQDGIDYDFQAIQLFETPKSGLQFTGQDTPGHRTLPDRFIQFLGSPEAAKNRNRIGFALGYSLTEGLTALDHPTSRRNSAGFIHTSSKTYPFAVDESFGNPVAPGTVFDCLAYRQYFNPALQTNTTSVFWHDEGDKTIVYIDYHQAVTDDRVRLPKSLTGRPYKILTKTESVNLGSPGVIPRDGLKITSPSDHGVLVIEVEKASTPRAMR